MSISEINRRIDNWWERHLDATDEIDIKRVADSGVDEFVADLEFCKEYARYSLRNDLYRRGIAFASQRRREIREDSRAATNATPAQAPRQLWDRPDEIVPPSPRTIAQRALAQETTDRADDPSPSLRLASPVATVTKPWSEYPIHDPETGLHRSLLRMSKRKLLKVIAQKKAGLGGDVRDIAFLSLIAGRLPSDDVEVGDVMTEADISLINANIEGKIAVSIGLAGLPKRLTWESLLS